MLWRNAVQHLLKRRWIWASPSELQSLEREQCLVPSQPQPVPIRGIQLGAALYARVSTRDKDQDPTLQLTPMREYAASRGWEAGEYVDHASASDMSGRKAWARLIEDARRRRIDHVMAWKLDRPFRSTLHRLRTLEAFGIAAWATPA
jgi:Resolvase, N terminal domain